MTTQTQIHPVILCGGSGTRLWPASRPARPKPFLPLIGEHTLFEEAIARVADPGLFADPLIVAGEQHRDLIEQQMHGAPHRLVIEPAARNTAPAIALAAALVPADDVLLVCPSDHHIGDAPAFREAAVAAAKLARDDRLVAFGIKPDRPETGYGYIRHGERVEGGFAIDRFVEKPDEDRAREYLASGEYSWNGGIFAFRAGVYLAELAAHRPAMAQAVQQAVADRRDTESCIRPAAAPFEAIEGESIDYAVMENTARAAMVPVDMGWSDIGNWAALHDALILADGATDGAEGRDRNVTRGAIDLARCSGVLAQTDSLRISAVGLDDVCIVVADGEVLVTARSSAQHVGKLPGASGS